MRCSEFTGFFVYFIMFKRCSVILNKFTQSAQTVKKQCVQLTGNIPVLHTALTHSFAVYNRYGKSDCYICGSGDNSGGGGDAV